MFEFPYLAWLPQLMADAGPGPGPGPPPGGGSPALPPGGPPVQQPAKQTSLLRFLKPVSQDEARARAARQAERSAAEYARAESARRAAAAAAVQQKRPPGRPRKTGEQQDLDRPGIVRKCISAIGT